MVVETENYDYLQYPFNSEQIQNATNNTCSMAGAVQFSLLGLHVGCAPLLGAVDEMDGDVDVDSASLKNKTSSRIIISIENRRN